MKNYYKKGTRKNISEEQGKNSCNDQDLLYKYYCMSYLLNAITRPARRVGLPTDMFSSLFDDPFFTQAGSKFTDDNIRFNENDKQFRVEIDLPGVKKENLEVTSEGDQFYISASRTVTKNGGSKDETYTRSFSVNPTMYDTNTLGCTLQDGMLVITLSRKVQPKKEIKVVQVQ